MKFVKPGTTQISLYKPFSAEALFPKLFYFKAPDSVTMNCTESVSRTVFYGSTAFWGPRTLARKGRMKILIHLRTRCSSATRAVSITKAIFFSKLEKRRSGRKRFLALDERIWDDQRTAQSATDRWIWCTLAEIWSQGNDNLVFDEPLGKGHSCPDVSRTQWSSVRDWQETKRKEMKCKKQPYF